MSIIQAEYHSLWDGSMDVESRCAVNGATGLVEIELADDELTDELDMLDREYVRLSGSKIEHAVEEQDGEYFLVDLQAFVSEALQVIAG